VSVSRGVRQQELFTGDSDMASRLCFAFVIFFFAGILILAVYLRSANHRVFYTLRRQTIEQNRLQQELWQKQLRVEALTSPAAVMQRLDQ
jgi:hypothetical protein